MLQRFEQTDSIDVDVAWVSWLQCYDEAVKACVPEITIRKSNLPLWFDSEVRLLKIKKNKLGQKLRELTIGKKLEK